MFATSAHAGATGPTVDSLSVSPTAVDVTNSQATVSVSATVSDDVAPVGWLQIYWSTPSGSYTIGAYPSPSAPGSNTWTSTFFVPQYHEPGLWHVSYIVAYDTLGNSFYLGSASAVANAGLDAPISVTGAEDLVPPQFQSLSLSPSSIDITNGPGQTTVTAAITDDVSGVSFAVAQWTSPSGARSVWQYLYSSGSGNDFTGTVTVPRWDETGDWHVSQLTAYDHFGRATSLSAAAAAAAGLDSVLTVTGAADVQPPAFQSVSLTPGAIDVGASGKTVNVSVTVTDDVSGVQWAQLGLASPLGGTMYASLTRSAVGSDTWTGALTIPRYADEGAWHVSYLAANDAFGRWTVIYGAGNVAAAGLDSPVAVTVTPVLPVDHFKVRVSPLSVAPGDPITVAITAQDTLNQTVPGYVGPVTLTDPAALLTVIAQPTWLNGVGTALVSLPSPYHGDSVKVQDASGLPVTPGGPDGTSNTFNVIGDVTHFSVRLATNAPTAGNSVGVTVTALDSVNQAVPTYGGPVTLSNLAGGLSVGSALSWSQGIGTGTVSFSNASRGDKLTATDASGLSPAPSGTSSTLTVIGPLDHFRVRVAPTSIAAGGNTTVTVTALDSLNQTIVAYAGSPTLSDLSGSLSIASGFSWASGVGSASVSVATPFHADTVTATDPSGATGTSNTLNVIGAVDHFLVRMAATSVSSGNTIGVTATAQDALNQTVTTYTGGAVTLADLSGSLSVASSMTWVAGVGTASVWVSSAYHADRVIVTDAAGTTGTSNTFNVAGPAHHLIVRVSPTTAIAGGLVTVTITAQDALNQTVTGFTSPLSLTDLSGTLLVVSPVSWSNGVGTATVRVTTPYHADRVNVYSWWYGFNAASNTFNVV